MQGSCRSYQEDRNIHCATYTNSMPIEIQKQVLKLW